MENIQNLYKTENIVAQKVEHKKWIDNLRWITIVLVVIFHVFYYYNNIGIAPVFERLSPNPSVEGEKAAFTFAGFVQYAVYQWFMLLLFILSGICAKYTLQKKSLSQFLNARVQKLLVPGTLGVLSVQWIGGWILSSKFMNSPDAQPVPGFIKYIISVFSGIGALWFCHVLIVACLILALIRLIDKNFVLEKAGEKSNIFVASAFVIVMIGAAQILNIKMIPTYRFGYDAMAFLAGYYIFSGEKILNQLKKYGWFCFIPGLGFGIWYFVKFYGVLYSDASVQNNWISVIHGWFMMMGILGVSQTVFDFENKFSRFMKRAGWGIYVNHILIMIILNTLLEPIVYNLPVAVVYLIELAVTLPISVILWEGLSRIPVIRFVLYGIKGKSKNA